MEGRTDGRTDGGTIASSKEKVKIPMNRLFFVFCFRGSTNRILYILNFNFEMRFVLLFVYFI